MATNFIHHEIERINKQRTRIVNKLSLFAEGSMSEHLLNDRYFDLTWQVTKLEELQEQNQKHL